MGKAQVFNEDGRDIGFAARAKELGQLTERAEAKHESGPFTIADDAVRVATDLLSMYLRVWPEIAAEDAAPIERAIKFATLCRELEGKFKLAGDLLISAAQAYGHRAGSATRYSEGWLQEEEPDA